MPSLSANALAHPNIAFIKYWGNRDDSLRLPASGSISMNLAGLVTQTCITFDPSLRADALTLNRVPTSGAALTRMSAFLDLLRGLSNNRLYAKVESENNFPTGAGIASSASAFAALSVAAAQALGLDLDEARLSRLARRGSGSACRSVPGGFVEWLAGMDDASSYARSIAAPEHWELRDLVAVVQAGPKPVGSSEGHALAGSSPLQGARLESAARRLDQCRRAILTRDFEALADVVEADSNLMHAVMQTSRPPLFYWEPLTLLLMKEIPNWRRGGLAACYTVDAGPNVHVLCPAASAPQVKARLMQIPEISQVLEAAPGGAARLADPCTLS